MHKVCFLGLSLMFCLTVFGRAGAAPVFLIGTNDIIRSSIRVESHGRMASEAKIMSVEFDFTIAGSNRLKEFYQTNVIGAPARFQIGAFSTSLFGIYDRKNFKGCLIFPVTELQAKQILADLKGIHVLPGPEPVPFIVTRL